MTLADIVDRGVQAEWHEAVAVVRSVAEWSAGAEAGSVPELHEVELLPNGQVEVVGGAVVDDPVDWLLQMLQALMGAAKVPPHLAELTAQPHESLQAFSDALGYFERPNRAAILQDLYSRATGSPPLAETANADELIASLRATALPPSPDNAGQKVRGVSHRRRLYYAAGGLAVVGAVLVGAGLARRDDGSSAAPAPSTLTEKVSAKVTGAADAVAGAVVSILGGGSAQPAASTEAEKPKPKEETVPKPRATRDRQPASSAPPAAPPSAPAAAPSQVEPAAVRKGEATQPERVDPPPRAVPKEPVTTPPAAADETVYSAGSPGVSAPVGIRPQLPKEMPPGVKPEDLTRIELVISADGTVASVKLLGQPRTVHDSMLLSAAKSWRFRPATKDGTPVPYRLAIWVAPGLVPGSRQR